MVRRLPISVVPALVALALVLAPGASAATPCHGASLRASRANLPAMRDATICLLNRERAKRGLPALSRSARLTAVASEHSRDMVRRKYFGHGALQRARLSALLQTDTIAQAAWSVGENIAWGTKWRASPRAIVALWMTSPGHRANILDPKYRQVGVGIARGNPVRGMRGGATYTTRFYSNK